ncbi:hypothetical protein FRC08_004544 [Ceratobasidium sp. 394]|nr:hypothetical protein FRC08_004544 [Ceratobasidium sp. 394]KAG9099267.1 hypothetical protein FS749_001684 [Ceratobasidium sp. UAMH 11750]
MPPTSNNPPEDPAQHHEEDYSDAYQAPPTHSDSSEHSYSQPLTYPPHSSYYPGAPASYPQSMPPRVMAPAPSYSYDFPAAMPGSSQLPESPHPPQPYVGAYGGPPPALQRSDNFYYSQPPMPETPYGHQYMPFRQPHILQYPDASQPSSPHPSISSPISQRPNSPDQRANDPLSRRFDEARYGSMANSYRRIITTVSQASPSPSTDSSGRSFERPLVDDMLHRAVEGLRHLDPSMAERYGYPYEHLAEMPSGIVGEAPPDTMFVPYYEEGRADTTLTKKKKRERKGTTQCASCHATSTPEWRRGPLGPRTLCNACGLVYAKLMKKRIKEEEDPSSFELPRRPRSGRSRQTTEESEESRGADDDAAGPSTRGEPSYPP